MENYTIQIWILLFFIYSFLGWVWETCFVSIKNRKLENRGFLYGPMLPIYGFGAVVVLISTLPVKDNLFLVFILGAFGATVLEFFTGYLMETLFKTRYWDYTNNKFNYKGYICLLCTIAWGFFSIIMIEYIHVPVEEFIFGLSSSMVELIVLVLVVIFTVDVTKSVQNALDLRELLETMANNNEKVSEIFEEIQLLSENIDSSREELKEHLTNIHNEVVTKEYIRIERLVDSKNNKELRLSFSDIFDKVTEVINNAEQHMQEFDINKNEKFAMEISNLKSKVQESQTNVSNMELKRFKGAISQLRRNPNAGSHSLNEELSKAKEL